MLVSIIVPIYNVEKYLKRCLKSIVNQTYPNLEIILVNDGSTDNSLKIAKNFKSDHRIKIINQKNRGLSAARNQGISLAKGEYLAFIDSDDYVEPNFIKNLVEHSSGFDLIISGYKIISSDHKLQLVNVASRVTTGELATVELLTRQEDYQILVWNKLYAKVLFEDIKYPEGKCHEDNLTTYKLVSKAKQVKFISYTEYHYFKRSGSITSSTNISDSLRLKKLSAMEAIDYFSGDPTLTEAAKTALLLANFSYLDHILNKKMPDPRSTHFNRIVREIINAYPTLKNNRFISIKLRLYIIMLKTPNSSAYRLFRKLVHA